MSKQTAHAYLMKLMSFHISVNEVDKQPCYIYADEDENDVQMGAFTAGLH